LTHFGSALAVAERHAVRPQPIVFLLNNLLQSQSEGRAEPFGSHYIGKERYHEVSSHFGGHQKHQYP
jgi:hypothetical protein